MIPTKIKDRRLELELTQEDLAQEVGVDERTIRAWECGEYDIKISNLEKLAEALKTTVQELI